MGGPLLNMVYAIGYFIKGGIKIFYHKKLEADDCLALLCKKFYNFI